MQHFKLFSIVELLKKYSPHNDENRNLKLKKAIKIYKKWLQTNTHSSYILHLYYLS